MVKTRDFIPKLAPGDRPQLQAQPAGPRYPPTPPDRTPKDSQPRFSAKRQQNDSKMKQSLSEMAAKRQQNVRKMSGNFRKPLMQSSFGGSEKRTARFSHSVAIIITLLHYYIITLSYYYIITLLHYYIITLLYYYIISNRSAPLGFPTPSRQSSGAKDRPKSAAKVTQKRQT